MRLRRGQTTHASLAHACDLLGIKPGQEFELLALPPDNVCALDPTHGVEPATGFREIVGYEPIVHDASAKGKSVSAQRRTGRRVCARCVSKLRQGTSPTQEELA